MTIKKIIGKILVYVKELSALTEFGFTFKPDYTSYKKGDSS